MTAYERLWSFMIKPWMIVLCLVVLVLSFLYLDKPMAYFFHDLRLEKDLPIIKWLTFLGMGVLYFVPLFLIALYFRYIQRNKVWEMRIWFLWLCVLIPSLICLGLKSVFGRARPSLLFNEQVYGLHGFKSHAHFWSLPSGHTSTIMGFVFGLCVLFPRFRYVFILMGLIVASTRVMLTNHYFSDVLVAMYLAFLEVGLLVYWLRRKQWLGSVDIW